MGDMTAARRRIAQATASGSESLDLSELQLTTADLSELLPELRAIDGLKKLNLASNALVTLPSEIGQLNGLQSLNLTRNRLTGLPPEIGSLTTLTILGLSNNQLTELPQEIGSLTLLKTLVISNNQLTGLPQGIGSLNALIVLGLSNNQLTELPQEIGNLTALRTLNLFSNRLTVLPETLANLAENLRELDITDNPLSVETMTWLGHAFQSVTAQTDMAAHDRLQVPSLVLSDLYGAEAAQQRLDTVHSLAPGSFQVEGGGTRTGPEVVEEFLRRVPFSDSQWPEFYRPALRHLLDQIFATGQTEVARQEALQQMSTAIGNCATPVKSFLTQAYIGQQLAGEADLSGPLRAQVVRIAVEQKIVSGLRELLADNEKIEQVQGLVNSLFMPGAETFRNNKVKIMGDRERLASLTAYPDFAFRQVSGELAVAFARLCCKADASGEPLRGADGRYELDPAKLRGIVEPYLADHGIVSDRERYVQRFSGEFTAMLREDVHSHLVDSHYDKDDVTGLIDIGAQQHALRDLLLEVGDESLGEAYAGYLDSRTAALAVASAKYRGGELSAMAEPLNAGDRSSGPDRPPQARTPEEPCIQRCRIS